MPSRAAIALRVALLVLAVLAASASTWLFILYPSERGPGSGRVVSLVVPGAPRADDLTARLAAAGLLAHPRVFVLWLKVTGGAGSVVAGAHLLSDDATPRELIARLERRPGGGTARVTFPEGWTRFDMARRLQEKRVVGLREFLDATVDAGLLGELGIEGDSAEGFLFPATYDFALDDDARDIVRRMKREFDRRWDTASRAHPATLTDVMTSARMGVRELVTLASMIEREAAVDEERPVIASVFLNRLRDPTFHPKRLECDPTAAYGCLAMPERAASCAAYAGKPTAAIEHDPDNPYSTYTHEGLPPGPIANPGARSIEAAMAPASTHYYFFVARGEGRHTFSETYDGQKAAIRAAGASRAAEHKLRAAASDPPTL
ncbi:MAG: endolytic transglycosylase MltG [Myxococcales bacterium]|nr:endolytic transglycosylase MltG [Myxococcales bacterium]